MTLPCDVFAERSSPSDAFSPAAREINCLLVYGDLNSNEGEDICGVCAELPLAKALPRLIDDTEELRMESCPRICSPSPWLA